MRCTLLAAISPLLFSTALAAAQTAGAKKPKAPPPPPPPPPPPAAEPTTQDSAPHHASQAFAGGPNSLDLGEGRYGFSFGFPDGGSIMGSGYIGARYFMSRNNAIGGYLLLGSDSSAETTSFGLAGKYSSYFAQRDRMHLYWFAQLSLGQNGGKANEGKDDALFGLGGGAGLEYVLLKDFSVSAEGGIGYNTLPNSKSAYATGTGKLAINFYY